MAKKKSKRKAEKLRRKTANRGFNPADYVEVPRPEPLVTEDTEFVDAPDVVYRGALLSDEDVAGIVANLTEEGLEVEPEAPAFDHAVYDTERPVRWSVEEMRETGDWVVADSYTGLRAVCGTQSEAVGYLGVLVNGGLLIDHLVWREPEGMPEVFISSENESHQYWAILDEDKGFAILDRFARLVYPIPAPSWDMPYEQEVEEAMALAVSLATSEYQLHWVTLAEWLEPESDTVGETDISEAVSAALEDSQRPVRVLLVSSRNWAWKGIVREILQTYWNGLGNPPMTLLTSGMPYGAESVAYEFLDAGNITHEVIHDSAITPENVDYAFAFVSNYSEGATKAVERLRVLEIPFHLVEETSAVIPDQWAGR